jgi:quinoprotein glucose dehydrogenase
MNIAKSKHIYTLLFLSALASCNLSPGNVAHTQWQVTGGSKENLHYSSLTQIDTSNVGDLQIAWTYYSENRDSTRYGAMECNPIIIDTVLYGVSPKLKLFAINALTGKEIWTFNPADSIAKVKTKESSIL